MQDPTVLSTASKDCPACQNQRMHTDDDWARHPFKGHGYTVSTGWSHPSLIPSNAPAK